MSFLEKYYTHIKWIIILLAYGFLGYKLWTFDNYKGLSNQWNEASEGRMIWLFAVLVLLPINWFIEAGKWKFIIADIEKISFSTSFKSILSGITLGFFTPNRIGEFPARVVFLKKNNRLKAVALGFLGTLSQTLSILIFGIPAAIIFFTLRKNIEQVPDYSLWLFFIVAAILLLLTYVFLPNLSKRLLKKEIKKEKVKEILVSIANFSTKKLFFIFAVSLSRFVVFCIQFYCMLQFFGVELSAWEAVIGITANYLFVTFTPSVAFAEMAVRGSYAMIFIGAFSPNIVGVGIAGAAIWLVNYCIPMIIGSFFFSKTKLKL